jgi:hypothetical protein
MQTTRYLPAILLLGFPIGCSTSGGIEDAGAAADTWAPDAAGIPTQDAALISDAAGLDAAGSDTGSVERRDAGLTQDGGFTDAGPPEPRVGNCDQPTPWHTVAPSLLRSVALLPTPPEQPLPQTWQDPLPQLMFHTIEAQASEPLIAGDSTQCRLSSAWDPQRVQVGGLVPATEQHPAYCRVAERAIERQEYDLQLINRYPTGSRNIPITGEPNWVQFRFPIPDAHQPTVFSYTVNRARLFGSHPQRCHPDDSDENGNCSRRFLAESEDWSDPVEPGLFLLWARAGDCEGWLITGPHEPAAQPSWSQPDTYRIQVPESLRRVDELVVTLLTHHQYPGGCVENYCSQADGTYGHLGVVKARLQTEATFEPPHQPPRAHPRLFGDNQAWLAHHQRFDALACNNEPNVPSFAAWGGIPNLRNVWDRITKGGAICTNDRPEQLRGDPNAADYLDGSAAEQYNVTRSVTVLHRIRFERACRQQAPERCLLSDEELTELTTAVIRIEMGRIRQVPWQTHGFDFDLRTREPMRIYTLLADILWDELSAEQHAEIATVTGQQIDAYLVHFHEPHWAIYNGNNWTPVLAEAALYWAITYYHEDERAPEVAWRALQSLWLHRNSYLPDGVYKEGLLMYSQVSFDPLMAVARLAEAAFGVRPESLPWERMGNFADWAMAFVASDGQTIDFSDAWMKVGWGTFMPLLAHMADPDQRALVRAPDPCFAHRFFSNKYYHHGLGDPWNIHPALARDWYAVTAACAEHGNMVPQGIELRAWEHGGWGNIRIGRPGATGYTDLIDGLAPSRFRQADQVTLAVSAIPNSSPHTELDFGTLVWTAFGNRLIWDFGYGTLNNRRYLTTPDHAPDQNPTGHSTLVIPEALLDGDPSTNTSQISGATGTLGETTIDGHRLLILDGSAVYGRDDVNLGWLSRFHRRLVPLESGVIVVIDDFAVRPDRGAAAVAEYWYTINEGDDEPQPDCRRQDQRIARTVQPGAIRLVPRCSGLEHMPAQSAGLIQGLAREPGRFVDEGDVSLINRLNDRTTRTRIAWRPDAPVANDLRLFALIPAVEESELPEASFQWTPCDATRCARLDLNNEAAVTLHFDAEDQLIGIQTPQP